MLTIQYILFALFSGGSYVGESIDQIKDLSILQMKQLNVTNTTIPTFSVCGISMKKQTNLCSETLMILLMY